MSGFIGPIDPKFRRLALELIRRIGLVEDRVVEITSTDSPVDHGALTGLGDDDHGQYALADGSRGNFDLAGSAAAAQSAAESYAYAQDGIRATAANLYADNADDAHSTADRGYTDVQDAAYSASDRAYSDAALATHTGAPTGAHDASAIHLEDVGILTGFDDVEKALNQLAILVSVVTEGDVTQILEALNAYTSGTELTNPNIFATDLIIARHLTALSVIAGKISANGVIAGNVAADVITAREVLARSLTAEEILAFTLTSNEIATDTLTGRELSATARLRVGRENKINMTGGPTTASTAVSARGDNPTASYETWVAASGPHVLLPLDGSLADRGQLAASYTSDAMRVNGPAMWFPGDTVKDKLYFNVPQDTTDGASEVVFEFDVSYNMAYQADATGRFMTGAYIFAIQKSTGKIQANIRQAGGAYSATAFVNPSVLTGDVRARYRIRCDVTAATYYIEEWDGSTWTVLATNSGWDGTFYDTTAVAQQTLGGQPSIDGVFALHEFRFGLDGDYQTHGISITPDDIAAAVDTTPATIGVWTVVRNIDTDSLPRLEFVGRGAFRWCDPTPMVVTADWADATFADTEVPNCGFTRKALAAQLLVLSGTRFSPGTTNTSLALVLDIPEGYTPPAGPVGLFSRGGDTKGFNVGLDGWTVKAHRSAVDIARSPIAWQLPGPGLYAIGVRCDATDHRLYVNGIERDRYVHTTAPVVGGDAAYLGTARGRWGGDGSATTFLGAGGVPIDGTGLTVCELAWEPTAKAATWFQDYHTALFDGFATGSGFYADAAARFSLGQALRYENGALAVSGDVEADTFTLVDDAGAPIAVLDAAYTTEFGNNVHRLRLLEGSGSDRGELEWVEGTLGRIALRSSNAAGADTASLVLTAPYAGIYTSQAPYGDAKVELDPYGGILIASDDIRFFTNGSVWSVTTDEWTNLTYAGGASTTTGRDPLGYDEHGGKLWLRGEVELGTKTDATIIATLPLGARPTRTIRVPVTYDGTRGTAGPSVYIDTSGNIRLHGCASVDRIVLGNQSVSLA